MPKLFSAFITFLVVIVSFAIFIGSTPSYSLFYLDKMFFPDEGNAVQQSDNIPLTEHLTEYLFSLFFMTGLVAAVKKFLTEHFPRLMVAVSFLVICFLFGLTVAAII